jgi:hypothetical protein
MKYVYLTLNWIFGVFFLIIGLVSINNSPLAGLSLVLLSLLLLPPVRKFTGSKTNKEIPTRVRAASIFALFIASGVFFGQSRDEKAQEVATQQAQEKAEKVAQIKQDNIDYFTINREQIILSASSAMVAKEYQLVITQTSKYLVSDDKELKSINSFAKIEIEKIKKSEKTNQLLAELKKIPSSEYEKNKNLYQQLVRLHPNTQAYKIKVKAYSEKFEKEKQEQLAIEARKKNIDEQFSAWDGSHRNLERVIKKAMNDPDSYEHAETVYSDREDHLVVKTTYRGKNAFGGVVKNYVKAKVSLEGQILKILDET